MNSDINREGTINAINWLAEEENNINNKMQQLIKENTELKMENEKRKCIALSEMYGAIKRCGEEYSCSTYENRICNYALAMIYMCEKLKIIDRETGLSLTHYIEHLQAKSDNRAEQR